VYLLLWIFYDLKSRILCQRVVIGLLLFSHAWFCIIDLRVSSYVDCVLCVL
jgi:hypothetical protein